VNINEIMKRERTRKKVQENEGKQRRKILLKNKFVGDESGTSRSFFLGSLLTRAWAGYCIRGVFA
jgi:hypothetical protein